MRHGLSRLLVAGGCLALVAVLAFVGSLWWSSRLPGTYNVMEYGSADYGGGPEPAAAHTHAGPRHAGDLHGPSVASLTGPQTGTPDARFTLTARRAAVRLPSGRTADLLTFDGRVPGPELRVRQGDLVEVTLRNDDVADGVSLHWHGVDVPNAEDGVAGVTQDAVPPGGRHVYRFRAEQRGTFWYHTHQSSAKDVRRGLYGAFVIEPRQPPDAALDLALVAHTTSGTPMLAASDRTTRRAVPAGTPVRLRLINADSTPQQLVLQGTPFRVAAIDGTDLHEPEPLTNRLLELAGGGRFDVVFTMPDAAVRLGVADTEAALVLSPSGTADRPEQEPGAEFDPATYGSPAPTPFGADSRFDRRFELRLGRKPGFLDGRPGMQWALNGQIFPDVPMFVVRRGDLVSVEIVNDTDAVHPMHLHGHHMLVLSRGDRPVTGSPWWSDTLNLEPGERYTVAFRADNPGLWMDHCHNLGHAADGLTMHVAYEGVWTPFAVGGGAHNHPE